MCIFTYIYLQFVAFFFLIAPPMRDCVLVNQLGDRGLVGECHPDTEAPDPCPGDVQRSPPPGGAPLCVCLQTRLNAGGLVRICFRCFFSYIYISSGQWGLTLAALCSQGVRTTLVCPLLSQMPLLISTWSTF